MPAPNAVSTRQDPRGRECGWGECRSLREGAIPPDAERPTPAPLANMDDQGAQRPSVRRRRPRSAIGRQRPRESTVDSRPQAQVDSAACPPSPPAGPRSKRVSLVASDRSFVPQTYPIRTNILWSGHAGAEAWRLETVPDLQKRGPQIGDLQHFSVLRSPDQTTGLDTTPEQGFYVGRGGIEPPTSALSGQRPHPNTPAWPEVNRSAALRPAEA
jgi:hypothetical protein